MKVPPCLHVLSNTRKLDPHRKSGKYKKCRLRFYVFTVFPCLKAFCHKYGNGYICFIFLNKWFLIWELNIDITIQGLWATRHNRHAYTISTGILVRALMGYVWVLSYHICKDQFEFLMLGTFLDSEDILTGPYFIKGCLRARGSGLIGTISSVEISSSEIWSVKKRSVE